MSKTIFRKNIEKKFKIALLTGGPSLERGISLNSARSALDHLGSDNVEIVPVYFDQKKKAYQISIDQLYSNNPSDFDFKLAEHSSSLSPKKLVELLRSVDIVFPAMHGPFGEDGQVQAFLEKNKIPFVGSGSRACKKAFDKYEANKIISQKGFFTLPDALLKIYSKDNTRIIENFFRKHKIKRAIVKPATGGSSIGTFSVSSIAEALEKANLIFRKRMDTRVVLEPFARGREFTVIVLQNSFGLPVALIPSEIEMAYHEGRIFDFRKKYLPTNQVKYHCPPKFEMETIEKIRTEAAQIFSLFGLNDFARFDGWVFPDGKIWFSDFNTVSGMEQNSFLFQQSSRLGMSHSDLLHYVAKNSCARQKIDFPRPEKSGKEGKRKPVSVIFGGQTSERQVSLMSGTNVWLKLWKEKIYEPVPYLLDPENNVWKLPYALILNHTVEEITENAENAAKEEGKNESLIGRVKEELKLSEEEATEPFFLPEKMSFGEFARRSKFVFLGLHGGDGENGNFQKLLAKSGVRFNGSDESVSRLCMDKFNTGEFIRSLNIKNLGISSQKIINLSVFEKLDFNVFWKNLCREFNSKTLIVKPRSDGCSTGVAHLYNSDDLKNYVHYLKNGEAFIPANVLSNHGIVELPHEKTHEVLFEKFIETDPVHVKGNKLKYTRKSGWVEITIGLLEENGKMRAFNPSITIAEGEVLSVEEKFQGGTGINLTPPPKEIVKQKAVLKTRKLVEKLVTKIGIKDYARIDAFMNVTIGALIAIEVNTLPALTPSTVFYHQALAENPKIFPLQLLEKIIKNSGY